MTDLADNLAVPASQKLYRPKLHTPSGGAVVSDISIHRNEAVSPSLVDLVVADQLENLGVPLLRGDSPLYAPVAVKQVEDVE